MGQQTTSRDPVRREGDHRGAEQELRLPLQVAQALDRDLPRLLRPGGDGVRGHRSSGPRGARGRSLRAARQVQHCRRRHAGHPQRVSRGGDYEKELIAERVATERSILSRILRVLPSPLWVGVGGGGSSYEATLVLDRTTPTPPAFAALRRATLPTRGRAGTEFVACADAASRERVRVP